MKIHAFALENGFSPVVGTTGFTVKSAELSIFSRSPDLGGDRSNCLGCCVTHAFATCASLEIFPKEIVGDYRVTS